MFYAIGNVAKILLLAVLIGAIVFYMGPWIFMLVLGFILLFIKFLWLCIQVMGAIIIIIILGHLLGALFNVLEKRNNGDYDD